MVIRKSYSSTTKGGKGRGASRYTPPHFDKEPRVKYYGVHACKAIFEKRPKDIKRIFVTPDRVESFADILRWAAKNGVDHKVAPYDQVARVAGTEHHEGVMIEARPLELLTPKGLVNHLTDLQRGVVLFLEGVDNPHNIGAILRTACFFGVNGVLLQSNQVNQLSGATCRVAEGAAEHLSIALTQELQPTLKALKDRGWSIVATTPHQARSIYSVKWGRKVVVIFGAEGSGLSEETLAQADIKTVVPRMGPVESLNVGAAVAGVLTEARRVVF